MMRASPSSHAQGQEPAQEPAEGGGLGSPCARGELAASLEHHGPHARRTIPVNPILNEHVREPKMPAFKVEGMVRRGEAAIDLGAGTQGTPLAG